MKLIKKYWQELFDIVVLLAVSSCFISCGVERQVGNGASTTAEYYRVEAFPIGQQTSTDESTSNFIELSYRTSTDSIWQAALRAILKLYDLSVTEEEGVQKKARQFPKIDTSMNRIQIGDIDMAARAQAIKTHTWKDKIVLNLIRDSCKTRVMVTRNVIIPTNRVLHPPHVMEMMSNGNYERWILTQIDDDLAGKIRNKFPLNKN